MEPKFQSSFIPKGPISSTPNVSSAPSKFGGSISLLPLIGNIIFVLTLLSFGGLFAYEKVLKSQIATLDKSLIFEESAIDPATIQQLTVASDQIKSVKHLLSKHVSTTNMFALLESSLLPNVQFKSFSFIQGSDGTVKISADGEATSYAVVAQQSSVFKSLSYLKNIKFDSLDLTDKGTISLKFQADADASFVSYNQTLNTSTNQPAATTPVTQVVSTTTGAKQ